MDCESEISLPLPSPLPQGARERKYAVSILHSVFWHSSPYLASTHTLTPLHRFHITLPFPLRSVNSCTALLASHCFPIPALFSRSHSTLSLPPLLFRSHTTPLSPHHSSALALFLHFHTTLRARFAFLFLQFDRLLRNKNLVREAHNILSQSYCYILYMVCCYC